MGTSNYGFTYLVGTNKIDLVGDTTTFLDEIDSTIKGVADEIPGSYTLPTASSSVLGGVKTGTADGSNAYITVTNTGVAYVPLATSTTVGAVKPDSSTITVSDGSVSVSSSLQTKITDAYNNSTTNASNITNLTKTVSTNTSNISSLTSTVTSLQNSLNSLTKATTYAQLAANGFVYDAASA